MKKSHRALVALSLALSLCAGILFSTRVTAAAAPSLFHNDERWYRDSTACLEAVNGVFYVPVDLFGMLEPIELSVDSRRGEFMVYNRTTGQYISALFDEKIATVNGKEEIYLNLYKLHGGYYYVPAEYFCEVLSLTFDVKVSSSTAYGVSVRIADGSETKTLPELLSAYDPVATEPPPTSFLPPVTADTAPPPVSSNKDTLQRTYYFTFNTVSADTYPDLLRVLRENDAYAAFFFTAEELSRYPERAVSAVVGGHLAALTCESAKSADDFLAQMDRLNEHLYSITKMTTRIVQLPGGTARSGFSEEDVKKITDAGYVLWDWTYDVPDSVGYHITYVEAACKKAMLESEIGVLRMSCNKTVTALIPRLIRFIDSDPLYTLKQIRPSGEEIRFAAKS
ncbi:MAG: hypothetical protein E7662_10370 [Ruminococcaceae bacterium]|nr:hypothetical protein [Oscillospiraceae bacterium]